MRWKRVVIFGMGGAFAILVALVWMTIEGVFDPPRPPPALTEGQRETLHSDTVAGFDAYSAGNYSDAIKLWHSRASASDSEAQFWLARMYDFGQGIQPNSLVAAELYKSSANLGHPIAMYNLAYLYESGVGVGHDPSAAFTLWERAATLGYARAKYSLARAYLLGMGVSADSVTAVFWYEQAAEGGEPWAMSALANRYFFGEGVGRDLVQSYKWAYIGGELGNARTWIIRSVLFVCSNSEERKRAKRLGDAWLSEYSGAKSNGYR